MCVCVCACVSELFMYGWSCFCGPVWLHFFSLFVFVCSVCMSYIHFVFPPFFNIPLFYLPLFLLFLFWLPSLSFYCYVHFLRFFSSVLLFAIHYLRLYLPVSLLLYLTKYGFVSVTPRLSVCLSYILAKYGFVCHYSSFVSPSVCLPYVLESMDSSMSLCLICASICLGFLYLKKYELVCNFCSLVCLSVSFSIFKKGWNSLTLFLTCLPICVSFSY